MATATAHNVPAQLVFRGVGEAKRGFSCPTVKEARGLRRIPKSRQHKPRQGTLLDLFRPKLA